MHAVHSMHHHTCSSDHAATSKTSGNSRDTSKLGTPREQPNRISPIAPPDTLAQFDCLTTNASSNVPDSRRWALCHAAQPPPHIRRGPISQALVSKFRWQVPPGTARPPLFHTAPTTSSHRRRGSHRHAHSHTCAPTDRTLRAVEHMRSIARSMAHITDNPLRIIQGALGPVNTTTLIQSTQEGVHTVTRAPVPHQHSPHACMQRPCAGVQGCCLTQGCTHSYEQTHTSSIQYPISVYPRVQAHVPTHRTLSPTCQSGRAETPSRTAPPGPWFTGATSMQTHGKKGTVATVIMSGARR